MDRDWIRWLAKRGQEMKSKENSPFAKHKTEFGTVRIRFGKRRTRKPYEGENDEEGFIRTSNCNRAFFAASGSQAQDAAKGEKTFKAKCAGCHGADAAGKPAAKSPSIKGKSADEITKAFSSSPKHASVKSLPPADVNDLAAYLATLK